MSRINRYSCLLYSIAFIFCSCNGSTPKSKGTQADTHVSPLEAYCHAIDYNDTLALHDETVMSKHITKIVQMLPATDSLSATTALSYFFNRMKHDAKALTIVTSLADESLNNPGSPVRDETLYIAFIKTLLATDSIPKIVRDIEEERLKTALLNRPGNVAHDFRFIDRNGNTHTLHKLSGEMILLLFYDPECSHCTDILKFIAKDPKVNSAISNGSLTVTAIYTEGKRDVWESNKWNMPENWLIGYDLSGIYENALYDLPAMPIIYLLDSNKRVLMKDPDVRDLFKALF